MPRSHDTHASQGVQASQEDVRLIVYVDDGAIAFSIREQTETERVTGGRHTVRG